MPRVVKRPRLPADSGADGTPQGAVEAAGGANHLGEGGRRRRRLREHHPRGYSHPVEGLVPPACRVECRESVIQHEGAQSRRRGCNVPLVGGDGEAGDTQRGVGEQANLLLGGQAGQQV